jgi:hypothetical protein
VLFPVVHRHVLTPLIKTGDNHFNSVEPAALRTWEGPGEIATLDVDVGIV